MANRSLLLLPVLLLSIIATNTPSIFTDAAGNCHPDDESALLDFKNAVTADPSNLLATWNRDTDCCTSWSGVTCNTDSRVYILGLYGSGDDPNSFLAGTVPQSFSKLRALDALYFENLKKISGPFPAAFLRLRNLTGLYVRNSQLSGPLPADIGRRLPRLAALSLAGNRFSGRIPPSLGELTQLTRLELSQNKFVGTIPHALGKLTSLFALNLDGNSLSGAIPVDLSSLTQLAALVLDGNRLSGEIPPLPPHLSSLSLANNSFRGRIPAHLGNLSDMEFLDLSANAFTGPVPSSFSNFLELKILNLSTNSLEDPFPSMKVRRIRVLDLSGNRFHLGKVPEWAATSSWIFSLRLRGCGLNMRLDDLPPVDTYNDIDLSDNAITGSPAALLAKAPMNALRLSGNKLRFDMGKLRLPAALKRLDVSHNSVYGRLPKEVAQLEELDVSYNHLCGPIPGPNKFPASAFANNDCLCGRPLKPCSRGRGV